MKLNIKNIGNTFLTGAVAQWGPNIMKGAMNEYLHLLTVQEFASLVTNDITIYDSLDPGKQVQIKKAIRKLGNIEWFTAEWVMANGREAAPAIHSMLASWPEAFEWLEKNIADLKQRGGN